MINIYSLFLSGDFGHLFPIVFDTTVSNVDSNVTTTPAVRKSALFTDDLTRNLRLVRKYAHITDKRTQKIQARIKSQQFWGKIERPQITPSLKLNLHDNMLNILDI